MTKVFINVCFQSSGTFTELFMIMTIKDWHKWKQSIPSERFLLNCVGGFVYNSTTMSLIEDNMELSRRNIGFLIMPIFP